MQAADTTQRLVDGLRQLVSASPQLTSMLLVAACLLYFLPGFFTLPPIDRAETRFAQATKQMLETGDFVDVRFQDQPRDKTPIGGYWLQAATVAMVAGDRLDRIWPYRLPSLLGAIMAVLVTAWLGQRLFDHATGLLAGLVLASCMLVGVEARLAKADAALLAAITVAQAMLAKVYLTKGDAEVGRSTAWIFWLAQGAGILLKGPSILLVSGCTVLWLWRTERQAAWLQRLRWRSGLLIVGAIVMPWPMAVTIASEGASWVESLGRDFLGEGAEQQAAHGASPGYFLAGFWLTFWPWSLLAGLVVPWVWSQRALPAVRFCIAWIVPIWIAFELAATKLPPSLLPIYPAMALLTAAAARRSFGWPMGQQARWRLWLPAVVWGSLSLALTTSIVALPIMLDLHPSIIGTGLALLGLIVLSVGLYDVIRRQIGGAMIALLVGPLLLYGAVYRSLLPSIGPLWPSLCFPLSLASH